MSTCLKWRLTIFQWNGMEDMSRRMFLEGMSRRMFLVGMSRRMSLEDRSRRMSLVGKFVLPMEMDGW